MSHPLPSIARRFAVVSTLCLTITGLSAIPADATGAPPTIDASTIYNGGRPCTATVPPQTLGYSANVLQLVGSHGDSTGYGSLNYTFAIWPTANPAAETDINYPYGSSGSLVSVNATSALTADTDYSWHARVSDNNGTSAWSPTCTFHRDTTAPGTPTITSTNFPDWRATGGSGPAGKQPVFVLDGHGDTDTAGFQYSWSSPLSTFGCSYSGPQGQLVCPADFLSQPDVIRADHPGGTATLRINPPGSGPWTMTVAAIDPMGNRSAQVQYQVFVPPSDPTVTVPKGPICGDTVTLTFSPNPAVAKVVSYTYLTQDGHTTTVAADKKGRASVTGTVDQLNFLQVSSLSVDGFQSTDGFVFLNENPQATVSSDVYSSDGQPHGGRGQVGTFTLNPPYNTDPVASYEYRFSQGPARRVTADDNQNGTIQWTPKKAGAQTLTVTALGSNGKPLSCSVSYPFAVG